MYVKRVQVIQKWMLLNAIEAWKDIDARVQERDGGASQLPTNRTCCKENGEGIAAMLSNQGAAWPSLSDKSSTTPRK